MSYLHPETKQPIHDAKPGQTVLGAVNDALEAQLKYVRHNGRVFDLFCNDTGLRNDDLISAEHEKTTINDDGMVSFYVSSRLDGKTNGFITSIHGSGATPQEALEDFRKEFEKFKVYYLSSEYYVVVGNTFVEITPEVAAQVVGEK